MMQMIKAVFEAYPVETAALAVLFAAACLAAGLVFPLAAYALAGTDVVDELEDEDEPERA